MARQSWEQYKDSQFSGGQVGQGIWNTISDPISGLARAGSSNTNTNFAAQNPQTSFSNPLGIDFTGGSGGWNADLAGDKDLYNSMTDADWTQFSHMNESQQAGFLETKKKQVAAMREQKGQADKLAAEAADRKGQQDAIVKKLQAFADEMNMPIDQLMQHDEFGKALNAATAGNSQLTAANRGLGGGISNLNADYASKRALLGYQGQRQAAGNQAYNQAYSMLSNQNATAEDVRRYNQGLDLQMQNLQAAAQYQNYMQGQGQASNTGGMIGGVIGGIYGGAGGAQAGQKIGSSAGGSVYSNNNPYSAYTYNTPSGVNGSGISGGGTYGGNY